MFREINICEIGAEVQTKSLAAAHEVHSQVAKAAPFSKRRQRSHVLAVRKFPTLSGQVAIGPVWPHV